MTDTSGIRPRYKLPDSLRGLTLLSMVLYHGAWDLVYLFGVRWNWYRALPGFVWQQSICWTFILLSGFCWPLGRHPLRRGLIVFGAGVLVSAVTLLAMPEQRILFGILTFLGSAMLLMIPLEKLLRRVPALPGLVGAGLLFALTYRLPDGLLGIGRWAVPLPEALHRGYGTAFLGFPPADFFSTDYFPLFPWLFLFTAGYFLCRLLMKPDRQLLTVFRWGVRPLSFLGRHSLLIYLLHQPLIYGLLSLLL